VTRLADAIALEEHFWIPELRDAAKGLDRETNPEWTKRLDDLGEMRLQEMDEAGIAVQILSHAAPAAQKMPPEPAVRLARLANDRLNEVIRARPDRFAGFAMLPTPDPAAAADELQRTVAEYGFKGGMIHGLTNGAFIDEERFWPIFARAEALGVPIYLHPATPHDLVLETYFKDYTAMARAGWGFTMETATAAIRLIMSGVFDRHPGLTIILGHLGESIPFSLWRCDRVLSRGSKLKRRFRDYFCGNFYITTSTNFSQPALVCCLMEMGADRILFSVDYPFATNCEARQFIDAAPLAERDRQKILAGNARRLFRL